MSYLVSAMAELTSRPVPKKERKNPNYPSATTKTLGEEAIREKEMFLFHLKISFPFSRSQADSNFFFVLFPWKNLSGGKC